MKVFIPISFFIMIGCSLIAICQPATTWRGPNQSGVYEESGLLDQWPSSGPEILWSFDKLGIGYSSPAIVNGTIYVSGMEGSTGYIYALSSAGQLNWKAPYGKEWDKSYEGTRATPVIAGDELYILSGTAGAENPSGRKIS